MDFKALNMAKRSSIQVRKTKISHVFSKHKKHMHAEQINASFGSTYIATFRVSTYFFSRLPAPVSLKPFANGLLSIFS